MAPPALRERALMPASVNPITGPAARTTALMAAVMLSPLICCHLEAFLKLERGIFLLAPWRRRYATWRRMTTTGNPWGWPVCPCPIDSPLTPFFWVAKRRLTKLDWESTAFDAVAAL